MINILSLINNAKDPGFYKTKHTNIIGVVIDDEIDIRICESKEIKISLFDTGVFNYAITIIPSTKKDFKTAYREFLKHLDNIKKSSNEGV